MNKLQIKLTKDEAFLIDSLLGQMSDGYWENNLTYYKYWNNIFVNMKDCMMTVNIQGIRYNLKSESREMKKFFSYDFSDEELKEKVKIFLAKKAKIILNAEIKNYNLKEDPKYKEVISKWLGRSEKTIGEIEIAILTLSLPKEKPLKFSRFYNSMTWKEVCEKFNWNYETEKEMLNNSIAIKCDSDFFIHPKKNNDIIVIEADALGDVELGGIRPISWTEDETGVYYPYKLVKVTNKRHTYEATNDFIRFS